MTSSLLSPCPARFCCCPCDGKHLPYQKAKRRIEKKITNKKTQERMLYLLEKTSRSDTLDHAIKKTQERYRIGEKGMKSLLKQFDAIQVNPITFRKDSKIKKQENHLKILSQTAISSG